MCHSTSHPLPSPLQLVPVLLSFVLKEGFNPALRATAERALFYYTRVGGKDKEEKALLAVSAALDADNGKFLTDFGRKFLRNKQEEEASDDEEPDAP